MKILSIKQLSGLIIIILLLQVSYLFYFKSQNVRFPANNSESPNYLFFKQSYIEKSQNLFYYRTDSENTALSVSCETFDKIEFHFEAEEVASFSDEKDGKVGFVARLDCIRATRSPIFYQSFCEGSGADSYEDGVEFKMINDPGFFPRSWYLKKAVLSNSVAKETYAAPREMLELLSITCDL